MTVETLVEALAREWYALRCDWDRLLHLKRTQGYVQRAMLHPSRVVGTPEWRKRVEVEIVLDPRSNRALAKSGEYPFSYETIRQIRLRARD